MRFADENALSSLLCALLLLRSVVRVAAAADDDGQPEELRLPRDSTPQSYDLQFDLSSAYAEDGSDQFSAVVTITTAVRADTKTIALNARDLKVTNVTALDVTQGLPRPKQLKVENWTVSERNERLDVSLDPTAVTSDKTLNLTVWYTGKIRTDETGLYRTQSTEWMVLSRFKPTYARRAFPCYDEPSYKAKFSISVVGRSKDQIALSNMPVRFRERNEQNKDVIYFETTPPMSTYLVAIYVGEFDQNLSNSSRQAVYTYGKHKNETKYIVTEFPKHLNALAKYTGIEYVLPKMDLVTVPDLSVGAMENWGLNTYQENLILLYDESKTKDKIRASEIVQHELAQQWFGNLVTSSWWDYMWQNQGLAMYFQYFVTKMVNEDWPMEEWFLVEIHQGALTFDQSPRHPLTSSVNTLEEIENIFDDIIHKKAASVFRMLRSLMTEDLFQKSLMEFLTALKEKVAEPNVLYEFFDSVLENEKYELKDGMTVNKFMLNWAIQSGYPVLNITKNETSNTFLVIQNRFLIKSNETDDDTLASWYVGLTYTTESEKKFNDTRPSVWTNKSSEVPVLGSGWYIFNLQSAGFYRVNYDVNNWYALIEQLNEAHGDIHVLNRAQLIDDAFSLARAGYLDYSVPLNLSKYLEKENDITPWYSAINSFSYLIERIPRNKEGFGHVKAYVSKLAGTIYEKLDHLVSSGNDEINVTKAWDTVSTWACGLGNADCEKKALEYFDKWQSGQKIPADIKDAAFCVGIKNSNNSSNFDTMFALYTEATSEKKSIESALGCSTNRTHLNEYIHHILDGPYGNIAARDYTSVVTAISVTPLGLDVLYEFLSTNLDKILKDVSNGEKIATFIYDTLATKITNDDEIEKIRNLKNNSVASESVRLSFEKSFEKVVDNRLWFDTYADGIIRWAMKNNGVDPTTNTTSTTVESSTSPVTEEQTTTTSVTKWTTDESTTSPETTQYTTTTTTYSTTPKDNGSPHVHYSFIVILTLTTIVVLVST